MRTERNSTMQGKVITVTGGANGIGAETGRQLATEGAHIVIAGINSDQGQAEAAGIVARGGKAIFAKCDIANPQLCEGAAQAAVDHFGRIDGLVNCADLRRRSETGP